MNFSQLQSFITVVQRHSFSEAAKQLHFSQSTITKHINELEKELGQQLLVRSTRDFKLTKAGMSFIVLQWQLSHERMHCFLNIIKTFSPRKYYELSLLPSRPIFTCQGFWVNITNFIRRFF